MSLEIDFQDWLYKSFKNGSLSKEEINSCLEDTIECYYLFKEYVDFILMDKIEIGEAVREEVYKFKISQSRSLK